MVFRYALALGDWVEDTVRAPSLSNILAFDRKRVKHVSDTATVLKVIRKSSWAVIVANVIFIVIWCAKNAVHTKSFSCNENSISLALRNARAFSNRIKSRLLTTLFSKCSALVLS